MLGAGSGSAILDLYGSSQQVAGLSDNASYTNGVVTNNGVTDSTITINQTTNTTFGGSLLDGPTAKLALIKAGNGTLVLTGSSSMSSQANVNAGVLQVEGALTVPVLNINDPAGIAGTAGVVNMTSDGLYYKSSMASTFAGRLAGGGGVEVDSGSLTLAGSNTYSGGTTVQAGTLVLANPAGAALGTGSLLINSGTVDATAYPQTVGSLTVYEAGSLNLWIGRTLTSIGSVSLSGTLNLFNLGSLSSGTTELMTYSSETGAFSSYTALPSGYHLNYGATELDIVKNAVASFSGSGVWMATGISGTAAWNNSTNWQDGNNLNGVPGTTPSRAADTATFNGSDTAATTIVLDATPSLTALSFSTSSYTLSGGSLTLNPGSGTAIVLDASGTQTTTVSTANVTVTSGTQTIASTIMLSGAVSIAPAAGSQLTITGNVGEATSGQALVLTDGGTLVLTGTANTYTGGTYAEQGTLYFQNSGAIYDGSSLIIGAGGTIIFDPQMTGSALSHSFATGAVAPVPEPGTMVLLLAAIWSAVACHRFSKRRQNRISV